MEQADASNQVVAFPSSNAQPAASDTADLRDVSPHGDCAVESGRAGIDTGITSSSDNGARNGNGGASNRNDSASDNKNENGDNDVMDIGAAINNDETDSDSDSDYDKGSHTKENGDQDDNDDNDDDGEAARQPGRLVVSLTTTPWRIGNVLPVLRNLVQEQTRRADAIHLYVPAVCKRNGEAYAVPRELADYAAAHADTLHVTSILADHGPATKLLPALHDYRRAADRIITVDDDVLLEPHTIEELCAGADRRPGAAIGLIGCTGDVRVPFLHAEMVPPGHDDARVLSLGGYRGVLYPRALWLGREGESIWSDYAAITQVVDPFLSDDHLFGWNLYRRDVPCYVVATRYRPSVPPTASFLDKLNFRFLDLGAPLTDADSGCNTSIDHLRAFYDSRGWKYTT